MVATLQMSKQSPSQRRPLHRQLRQSPSQQRPLHRQLRQSPNRHLSTALSCSALPFGEAHTRDPGFGGEGWTVSIDDVVPIETFFSDGDCLAIVGTATLDSLDEGLTSTGFSFPEASLFQAGVKNSGLGFCDGTGLESQGMVLYLNAEVTVGTTFTWFKPFEVVQTDFDFAAIEDTVYEP